MRNLIVTAFMSLDGVMEAPGGEPGYRNSGWTFKDIEFDPAAYEIKGREQEEAGALLLGRVELRGVRAGVADDDEDFAGYNAMPRYVVSTTLAEEDPRWPATILRSIDDVAALKETDGGPIIVHGSADARRRASPTPASSTATTCWSSRSCSAPASGSSARPTRTRRCSTSSSPRPTPTASPRSWPT